MSLTIAIISWKSPKTIENTLRSYVNNGLYSIADQRVIYFQEISDLDIAIANKYGFEYIGGPTNTHIAGAFVGLSEFCKSDHILFLENDFELICSPHDTERTINSAINLLDNSLIDAVKLRHRYNPGNPLYSKWINGKELENKSHLLESIHWRDDLSADFPGLVFKSGDWFVTTSRCANYTNNPVLYRTKWWLDHLKPHCVNNIEDSMQSYWESLNCWVAQGTGLFRHNRIDR